MPEETERPDETVLRRLREADTGNDTRNLRSYVVGGVEASQLDYEDWVRPLKLTGGRVCLRVKGPGWQGASYYCWHPDGLKLMNRGELLGTGPGACRLLRADLEQVPSHVTPVPVEATPFAEADDA